MTVTTGTRALATVWLIGDAEPFQVTQTPSEVATLVDATLDTGHRWVCLTLAEIPDDDGPSAGWAGRPVRIRADNVVAVGPPGRSDDE